MMPVSTCRFVCTWKSAPGVLPMMYGRSPAKTRYVFSVCIVRLRGASTFGLDRSSEKPVMRLFMMIPVPSIARAAPKWPNRLWINEQTLPSLSATTNDVVSDAVITAVGAAARVGLSAVRRSIAHSFEMNFEGSNGTTAGSPA